MSEGALFPPRARLGARLCVASNVLLSTSSDGRSIWVHRTENDVPDACATHTLPALAADTSRSLARVVCVENRFGDGMTACASCTENPFAPARRERARERRGLHLHHEPSPHEAAR